jgi:hypothetical protein
VRQAQFRMRQFETGKNVDAQMYELIHTGFA